MTKIFPDKVLIEYFIIIKKSELRLSDYTFIEENGRSYYEKQRRSNFPLLEFSRTWFFSNILVRSYFNREKNFMELT